MWGGTTTTETYFCVFQCILTTVSLYSFDYRARGRHTYPAQPRDDSVGRAI